MMPNLSFSGLLIVAAVAFVIPLALGLAPGLRLPSIVLEVVAGILIGPSVLGWVKLDLPLQVLALIGLAFSLFLAGLEIDYDRLTGRVLGLAGMGFALSFVLALGVGYVLALIGWIQSPLLVAIILASTSLGILIPLLNDMHELSTEFGQLVVAAASLADFATVVLLSLLFSREATGLATQFILLGMLTLVAVALGVTLARIVRSMRLTPVLLRLQDTSAQIRVRGAFVLLALFVALAERFGLEIILGAFLAGAIIKLIDRDRRMTHPQFHQKLEALGFGVFIPFFFVTSGIRFNLAALFAGPATLALVPVFLGALLFARGIPAILYRSVLDTRRVLIAGLLQATTLSFVVAAAQIGMELHLLREDTGAALVAAGLLSALLFPFAASLLWRRGSSPAAVTPGIHLGENLSQD